MDNNYNKTWCQDISSSQNARWLNKGKPTANTHGITGEEATKSLKELNTEESQNIQLAFTGKQRTNIKKSR